MENEVSQYFMDYIPASELISLWNIDESDLIIWAMRKQVDFYYPVKSEKRLTYCPVSAVTNNGVKGWLMRLRTFFLPFGLDNRSYATGQLIAIKGFNNLNALGKKVLSEILVLAYCHDTESTILRHEYIRNKFHPIGFEDILIESSQALALKGIFIEERAAIKEEAEDQAATLKPKSKQARREVVFLAWLAGKDEVQVSNMKKDDVWEELRKLDQRLFGVEPKNFFRDQKIITFKSGRKSS
jgi:hypothetical protein